MIVGIVGAEAAKFTAETEEKARLIIRSIYARPEVTGMSSGQCHLGGIDIWAEEESFKSAHIFNRFIFPAAILTWTGYAGQDGFKDRNEKIGNISDEVHCITVRELPPEYTGMRFPFCYHCNKPGHIKSGGCWTMKYAIKLGKKGILHVV